MSVNTELNTLKNTKTNLRTAIMEKGVVVSPNDPFSEYPTKISQISTQSGTYDESLRKLLDGSYTSYTIPTGTSRLKTSAFQSYTSLTSITIPPTVSYIGLHAFDDCSSLSVVNITDLSAWCKITFAVGYGDYSSNPITKTHALYLNGTLIRDMVIPNDVTSISNYAFYKNSSLTSVVIPSSVTTIGSNAFSNCSYLKTVEIGSGITSIGTSAFTYCSRMESITCRATTPPTLGNTAVFNSTNNCPIYVPEDSVQAYKTAWSTYESRIQAIPNDRLFNSIVDRSVTEIEIPNDVTTIGSNAFSYCTSLTTVTIPSSVTLIDYNAFFRCTALTSLTVNNTTPPTLRNGAIPNNASLVIYVPSASVANYKAASVWSQYSSKIQAIPS